MLVPWSLFSGLQATNGNGFLQNSLFNISFKMLKHFFISLPLVPNSLSLLSFLSLSKSTFFHSTLLFPFLFKTVSLSFLFMFFLLFRCCCCCKFYAKCQAFMRLFSLSLSLSLSLFYVKFHCLLYFLHSNIFLYFSHITTCQHLNKHTHTLSIFLEHT